ncbi:MAG: hypothetical protein EPN30_00240, partial [Actinomycetota bacterium]
MSRTIAVERISQDDAAKQKLRETAVRPMLQKPGKVYFLVVGVLGILVALAVAAFVLQIKDGKAVDGYSNQAFWGLFIGNFITIVGASYGGAVVSAVLRLVGATWRAPLTRIAEGTAVATVIIGGAAVIPSVGVPGRMFEFITRPNFSSPLIWDALAIGTYAFATIVFFYLPVIPDLAIAKETLGDRAGRVRTTLWRWLGCRWQGSKAQKRVLNRMIGILAIGIIPIAVSVHSVLAWAFANTSFRPWWSEELWAPLFVIAALYSGVALVILTVAAMRHAFHLEDYITDRHFKSLSLIMLPFGGAYFYMSVADFLPGSYHGEPGTASVFRQLFVGNYAPWFWIFVVGGMVVPILIISFKRTRRPGWIVLAAALVVATFWLNRFLMVTVPATYDMINGSFGVYSWTWENISVTLGSLAASPLLLLVIFRFIP